MKPRVVPPATAGFTLLEVMIALVLLGLLFTVLFSGLRLGATSWDAAEGRAQQNAERHLVLEFLNRYLVRAESQLIASNDADPVIAFHGEPDRLRWAAALPAHRGGGGISMLELRVGANGGSAGELVLEHRLLHPDTLEAADAVGQEILMEGIVDLRIEYFGALRGRGDWDWHDRWTEQNRLPRMVRLQIETDDGLWPEVVVAPRQAFRQPSITRAR